MHNIILCAALLILGSVSASAQFYTITKETEIRPEKKQKVAPDTLQRDLGAFESCKKAEKDSLFTLAPTRGYKGQSDQKSYNKTSPNLAPTKAVRAETKMLPALTIPNLYQVIIRNGIRHPKIVLAQAILETGWKYYEFNHWTESVRAYYTKVQYKYTGGNYLLWLHKIGYAEDPRYVREVMKVVSQL